MSHEVNKLYRIKSIMNYNGTYRLDGNYPQRVGAIGEIISDIEKDLCLVFRYEDGHGDLVTSHIRDYSGVKDKTNLLVKTQNSIYEFELIRDE